MSRGRKTVFALMAMVLFLAAAEGIARLLPARSAGALAENTLVFDANPELQEGSEKFWRRDPLLFWRMKSGLDADFGGIRLTTNSGGFRDVEHDGTQPDDLIIASVGDSTTFGWGVHDAADRFTDRLPNLLVWQVTNPAAGIRSLNFGQTGYSTVQASRLLQAEVLPLKPDVVVIMLAANDYGRASGHTDAQQPVASTGSTVSGLRRGLAASAFYRRLAGWLTRLRDSGASSAAGGEGGPDPLGILRRVPPAEFRSNLAGMVEEIRAAGSHPALMTYPRRPTNPVLSCPPVDWGDAGGLQAREERLDTIGPLLEAKVGAVRVAGPLSALAAWNELPDSRHRDPSFLYGLGYLLFREGRVGQAEGALEEAASASRTAAAECAIDLFSTALFRYREEPAAAHYNNLIRGVARETGARLVDVEAILRQAQMGVAAAAADEGLARTELLSRWFGDDSYFIDVVHPSGHALIAEALAEALGPVLGEGTEGAKPQTPQAP